jgi:hypothetical protein
LWWLRSVKSDLLRQRFFSIHLYLWMCSVHV